MPSKSEQIPILSGPEMDRFHFDTAIWNLFKTGETNLFHINRIEDIKDFIKFPLPPHRKTVIDFIFLTGGKSIRSKGLDTYEITAGDIFFLPAFQISSHEFYSPDAKGFYCHFDAEILTKNFIQPGFLNQFSFLQYVGDPMIRIGETAVATVSFILNRLLAANTTGNQHLPLVSTYLCALFMELQPFVVTAEKVKENAAARITQQYKNALSQHIYEKQSVSAYADLLAVTGDYLNKCVKAATGKPAHDLISDMMLMEVKALLKQTPLSISEIAFKIGKQDPSDFTRFFKSKTGFTPSQYRQMS